MAAVISQILTARNSSDYPESSEKTLLQWLDQIDREGKIWRDSADLSKWEEYLIAYHGRRYTTNQPKFSANVIRPTVDRRNALLTEQKPSAKIMPYRDGLGVVAGILEKLFDTQWHQNDLQIACEEMVQVASVLGSAGMDVAWNPAAVHGQGDIEPAVLDPRQVSFDPRIRKARLLDDATYVTVETIQNIWDLQRMYPGRGMLVRPERAYSSIEAAQNPAASIISQLSASYTERVKRLEDGPIPRTRRREYWIKDPSRRGTGQFKFPRGRKIERANQVILDDGENPYWDAAQPVVWFDLMADIDSPWGRSQVEALRYISNAINRIGNLFVENSVLAGNVTVITDADAITNETRNKLTNAAALIIPKKFGRNLEFRPPPAMPPHMLQFVNWALGMVDYLCGLRDGQMEGKGRVEMRSGVQLEGLQNAAQILIRASARRLESWIERFGYKWLSRVFQFYTGSRLMYQLGDNNEFKQWTFSYSEIQDAYMKMLQADGKVINNKTEALKEMMEGAWREFAFKVRPWSTLSSNRIARTQLLAQLAGTGRFPMSMVLREAGYDNAIELMQEAAQEIQQFGPPQPEKGGKKK